MIGLGKYLAAARGGPNLASKGSTGVVGAVARPGSGRKAARSSVSTAGGGAKSRGSMAGYTGGRSTYIEMNGAGYKSRPRPSVPTPSAPTAYKPPLPPAVRVSDYTRPNVHSLHADRDLTKML